MRLIDADALKAEWYRLNDINEEDCGARFVGYQEIARLINNAPTVEPTGDLISRADAIETVRKIVPVETEIDATLLDKAEVIVELSALPSADAVSRKAKCCPIAETCMSIDCPVSSEYIGRPSADAVQGEWIEKYNGNGWNDFWDYTCSNCGKKYERADYLYHANYCPNCGARMKGGAE